MTTRILFAALAGAGLLMAAAGASAATPAGDGFALPAQASAPALLVLARHGADDGPNHDANDDRGRRGKKGGKGRGRGADDGPNHTDLGTGLILARRGADDGPNHDANDDRGRRGKKGGKGRGRGADDGPNHT